MSRTALYQKYRSQTFDEIVGQEYVVRAIHNAVKENKVGHAYLFCGPRGTGKTSMARLLARAVNCENPANAPCGKCASCQAALAQTHPDIIEINAANETHVEDIRDLIERARLAPMMGHHKIYIIDEVHQLSSSAASALLKTLEEPPEHVIFILATTDPQKLLKTIISRCQRFDFSKVDTLKIKNHLLNIAEKEGFKLEENAALKIAELADGGMRDSLSILEQAAAYSQDNITEEAVNSIFGLASSSEKIALLDDIFDGNMEQVLRRITDAETHGVDLKRLNSDLMTAMKDGVIWSYTKNEELLHSLNKEQASHLAERKTARELLDMIEVLTDASERFKTAQSSVDTFEVACMELMTPKAAVTIAEAPKAQAVPVRSEPAPAAFTPVKEPVKRETPKPEVKPEPVPAAAEPEVNEPSPIEPAEPVAASEPEESPLHIMDVEEVLSILVQCNKTARAEDDQVLRRSLSGPMNKFTAALRQSNLAASGSDCILLMCEASAAANTIMDESFNRQFYEWLKTKDIDKMPFAVSRAVYDEAVTEFRKRMAEKNLPEAKAIIRWQKEEPKVKEPSSEEKAIALFGKENIEIIDE